MWNEHFGIGIVEMMAAGLIVIAHNSGGPQSDIVVPIIEGTTTTTSGTTNTTTGFLASTVEEYSDLIHQALCLDPQVAVAIRRNAQKSAKRFSDEVFAEAFEKAILELRVI